MSEERLRDAIEEMAIAQRVGDPTVFAVLLSQYHIEGKAFSASMLTVSANDVTDLAPSPDGGFVCKTVFPDTALGRRERRRGTKVGAGHRVSVEVQPSDIWTITMQVDPSASEMITLYP